MCWSLLNLGVAALAGAVFFYGLAGHEWRLVVPAAVVAAVFGLQWIGLPLLGWLKRALSDRPPCPSCGAALKRVDWIRWSGRQEGRRTGGARSIYQCPACGGRFKQELRGEVAAIPEGDRER